MFKRITGRIALRWRLMLVVIVFVAAGGGMMMLLRQPPMWPVFAALGLVAALGMWKRAKQQQGADQAAAAGGDEFHDG